MRELGYRTVDMLVERLSDETIPPLRRASPAEMRRRLAGPPPAQPEPFGDILARLDEDVLPFTSRTDHPGYLAFIPSCGTWPAALGELVASACNVYAGSWMESAGPSQLELDVLGWFKTWIGYPPDADGILVGGGSAANMTALAAAREAHVGFMSPEVVLYLSDQAHSSMARAARILGFRPDQVRVLPVDSDFRLPPETLAAALDADVRAGRRPLFVSASAGATNTGSIDSLAALAQIAHDRGAWFHVDAAYGGFAVLTERGRGWLAGIERADSITLDPHKWLYQPVECGCLLVRQRDGLRSAFEITPDYLSDAEVLDGGVNFADLGIQLTRSARALKIWISLRYFGLDAFRAAIDRSLDLAELVRRRVEASRSFELMAPPSLGVVCFRRRFPRAADVDELDALNAGLVAGLEESALGLISSTRLRGRYALRICVLNHTTRAEHLERVLDFLEHSEVEPAGRGLVDPGYDRNPDVRDTPFGRRAAEETEPHAAGDAREPRAAVDAVELLRLKLFSGVPADEAEGVAALATELRAATGDTLVEQWDSSRDFFVIAEGTAAVRSGDKTLADLAAGDFFGELAALDWGAGYGYPRLATVVATSRLRLFVFPDRCLNELMQLAPSAGKLVREAVEARLPRD